MFDNPPPIPPKNLGGRPPFEPTDAQRKTVRAMVAYGIPQDQIAAVIGISPPTLREHFRPEIDTAAAEANAQVAQTLFNQAVRDGNTAAAIWWTKARMGWKERQELEHGGSVSITVNTGIGRAPDDAG